MEQAKPKKSKRTKRVLAWLAGALGPWLLRALGRSWRVQRVNAEHFDASGEEGQRPIFTMWHQHVPSGSAVHRGEKLSVLISSHRDGEIIARSAHALGYRSIRGSSTRGGARAMRQLIGDTDPEWGLVFTPDGPRGPKHSVAPGAIFLAAMSGRPLIATGFAARRKWKINSWDRMRFPKPFTRVICCYSPPIFIDRDVVRDPVQLDAAREHLARTIHAMDAQAEKVLQQEAKS